MMENLLRYMSAKRLMERWNLEPFELRQIPIKGYHSRPVGPIPPHWTDSGLEEYEFEIVEVDFASLGHDDFFSCEFKMSEVLDFEEQHPELFDVNKIKTGALKKKKIVAENQYVFQQTGPTWKIIYQGTPLEGLKGKGFGYIHFLVKNPKKQYHMNEVAIEVDKTDPVNLDKLIGFGTDNTGNNNDTKKKKGTDHRDMVYGNSKDELKEEWIDLERELKKAKRNNDLPRIEKAENKLEKFKKHSYELFRPGGKSRQFIDYPTRNKNRISKSIKRALENIKKYDESTWQHFKSALDPIHSYLLSYIPDRNINWRTE